MIIRTSYNIMVLSFCYNGSLNKLVFYKYSFCVVVLVLSIAPPFWGKVSDGNYDIWNLKISVEV
jgi:hypothetical protein